MHAPIPQNSADTALNAPPGSCANGAVRKSLLVNALLSKSSIVVWRQLQPGQRISAFRSLEQPAACGHRQLVQYLLHGCFCCSDRPSGSGDDGSCSRVNAGDALANRSESRVQVRLSALKAAIGAGDVVIAKQLMRAKGWAWYDCEDALVEAVKAHSEEMVEEILATSVMKMRVLASPTQLSQVCAPEYNHCHAIILRHFRNVYDDKFLCRRLAAAGNLELIRRLDLSRKYFDMAFMCAASQSGHVPTVEFALNINPERVTPGTFSLPDLAKRGHLAMIEYLADQGLLSLSDCAVAAQVAVEQGHTDLLAYFIGNGKCSANDQLLSRAARCGRLPCVEYLLNHGLNYQPGLMDEAALHGKLHVVEWLAASYPEGCTVAAMRTAHEPVRRFLTEKYPEMATPFLATDHRPAFQAPAAEEGDDEAIYADDDDDYLSAERGELFIDDAVEEFLIEDEFDRVAFSRPDSRKHQKRALMHAGFKSVAPASSDSNQECKQS